MPYHCDEMYDRLDEQEDREYRRMEREARLRGITITELEALEAETDPTPAHEGDGSRWPN